MYPLQTALDGAKWRTKVYGWVEATGNLSTSRDRNAPETNDIYSNRVELGQAVVYVERLPDSAEVAEESGGEFPQPHQAAEGIRCWTGFILMGALGLALL